MIIAQGWGGLALAGAGPGLGGAEGGRGGSAPPHSYHRQVGYLVYWSGGAAARTRDENPRACAGARWARMSSVRASVRALR